MLKIDDIHLKIGEIDVLRGMSLEVEDKQRIGIIGPNGHGKSTTMMSISGMWKPHQGKIMFDGEDITGLNPQKIVEMGIILVPEGGHLFPDMTIYENLLMGAYSKRASKKQDEQLELVLSLFPKLEILKSRKANTLSGGELRMLAVGRGLMGSPKLLMLDEPTLGLQPNLVEEMGETLKKIGDLGTSVILSDENMDLVTAFADKVYFIENGVVMLSGPTKEVLADQYVKKTYLGLVD